MADLDVEGGAHFDAIDQRRYDGRTRDLADVETGEAVGRVDDAGVEAAEDPLTGGVDEDASGFDEDGTANLYLVEGGEIGLAVEAVAAGHGETA